MTTTTEMQEQEYEALLAALDSATKILRTKITQAEEASLHYVDCHYAHKQAYNIALLKSEESTESKRKADAEQKTYDEAKAMDVAKVLANSAKDRQKAQSKTIENIRYRIDIKRSLGAMHRSEAQLAGRGGEA